MFILNRLLGRVACFFASAALFCSGVYIYTFSVFGRASRQILQNFVVFPLVFFA